jgi:hypothetical protein
MTRNATLIDIAAMQALHETEDLLDLRCGDDSDAQKIVHAIVAAVAPLIRAAALEEAAKVAEDKAKYTLHYAGTLAAEDIATAIRSLKEQP